MYNMTNENSLSPAFDAVMEEADRIRQQRHEDEIRDLRARRRANILKGMGSVLDIFPSLRSRKKKVRRFLPMESVQKHFDVVRRDILKAIENCLQEHRITPRESRIIKAKIENLCIMNR